MTRDQALTSAVAGLAAALVVFSWQMQEVTGEDLSEVREWAEDARDYALNGGKP